MFASPKDRIWGIGFTEDDPRAWNKKSWMGQNLLGEVLTRVRDRLMGSNPGSANPPEAEKGASQVVVAKTAQVAVAKTAQVAVDKTAQVVVDKTAQVVVDKTPQTSAKTENSNCIVS